MNWRHEKPVSLSATVKGVPGGKIEFIVDGKLDAAFGRSLLTDNEVVRVKWVGDGRRHTIYVKVRGKDEKLVLVGNPIYIEGWI